MANRRAEKMDHDETGCQAPEGPILCINNCGFFGSPATMYMCSKCHKDLIIKQEQAKIAAPSIDSVRGKESIITGNLNAPTEKIEMKIISSRCINDPIVDEVKEKEKESSKRCKACKRRVGLSGFTCRCGELFCGEHRYSDKHGCLFDYRMAAQEAIAKANPVVKAEKVDKI